MADLSKIKLGNTVYDLKDATARANMTTLLGSHALAALGASAWLGVDNALTDGGEGVVTGGVIKSYVDSAIEAIPTFDVVIDSLGSDGKPATAASADTFHKIYLCPANDPATPNLYMEFLTIRSGTDPNYSYSWEKIGDTAIDLSGYVQKTQTIAGVDLQDNITKAELQQALELKALAYAATASVTVSDYATGITGASYTPAGDVTLNALTQTETAATLTTGDYTPAGSITGEAISGGSINVTVKDAAAASEASITAGSYTPAGSVAIAADSVGGTQISGSVSKPDVDVNDSSKETFVKSLKAGEVDAASYSHSGFDGGSLGAATKSAFAVEGIVAAIDANDAEQLNLSAATTSNAVTEQGTFTAATYGTDTFSAQKLPVVDATGSAVTAVTAELHNAPVFTGDKFGATFTGTAEANMKVTKVEYLKQEIDAKTFTPVAAELGFSGTKAENILVTGVKYDKATANGASFSGTAATITPTLDKGSKKITVSPDAE